MLEMLNPGAMDLLRFAANTVSFRLEFASLRKRDRNAAAAFLADRFCTLPASAQTPPTFERMAADSKKYFGWSAKRWRADADNVAKVISAAKISDSQFQGERLRCYGWKPKGKVRQRVLLCHGWEGYAFNFALLIRLALDAGMEVHAFDHLAHGGSSGRKGGLPIALDTLCAVAKNIGPVDAVVGHSLGGGATAWAAANNAITAKRFVLLAPFFDTYHLTKMWGAAHLLDADGIDLLREGLHAQSDKTFDDFLPAALAPKIRHPMLIIHDETDRMTRHQDSAAMVKESASVSLKTVKRLGHIGLLADQSCMEAVVKFIQAKT
jgi:pimeloyl-ACP methyl ester carboxylesterase